MNDVKIGIIGAGRIGKIHTDNLLHLPNVRIAGIADVQADSALREWAAARGISRVTDDSLGFIRDPGLDAVLICSLTDTHVPLIREAARAGKHIFCEKPVSMDVRETMKALGETEKAGVKLQIGFNRRFDRNFRRIRELVSEGKVGEPHIIKITSRDPAPPPEGYIGKSGGLFMDMAIHDFDMARFLSGSEVEEVYACGKVRVDPVFARYGDVDTAVTTLTFKNGAIGVIDNSRKAVYGYDQRVEVFGSGGSVSADNDFPNTARMSTAEGIFRDKPLHFFLERYREAYREELRMFVESIVAGTDVPVSGYDGLQAELIALAAGLSCRSGRPVRLEEALEMAGAETN